VRILVTGPAGFVGRVFLRSFSESPQASGDTKLFLLQNVSPVPQDLVHQLSTWCEVKTISADLTKPWVFDIEVDYVVNLAADGTNNPYSELSNQRYLQINGNLISWVKKTSTVKIIHISSGICDYFDENPKAPVILRGGKTEFARVRKLVESMLQEVSGEESIDYKVLRLYSFIGSELAKIQHYAVNQFICSAKKQGVIKVMGNSQTKRSYLLDRDLGSIINRAVFDLNFPSWISVASRYPVTMKELAEIISQEIPSRVQFLGEHLPVEDYLPIYSKNILPETSIPTESLSDTIHRMIREIM